MSFEPRPYRAFASYATDPDAKLVLRVEAFLETLDRNPLVDDDMRQSVQLCVDGSDFKLPNLSGNRPALEDLITSYLRQSDYLLVFAGPHAVDHPLIRWEIRWWLQNREVDTILISLTAADDHRASPEMIFPPEIIDTGLHESAWFGRGPTQAID